MKIWIFAHGSSCLRELVEYVGGAAPSGKREDDLGLRCEEPPRGPGDQVGRKPEERVRVAVEKLHASAL